MPLRPRWLPGLEGDGADVSAALEDAATECGALESGTRLA